MPVILKPEHYEKWLNPKNENGEELAGMLQPFPDGEMTTHPVGTLVNNPKVDDPRCIDTVAGDLGL
jgi:putative SOS response-associated peptidase YedK